MPRVSIRACGSAIPISWGLFLAHHGGMVRAVADTRIRLAHLTGQALEAAEFSHEVSAALRRTFPFDGWCLFGLDPVTGLRTFQLGGRGTEHTAEMARNEAFMSDVNKYVDLAASATPGGWLSPTHPRARDSFRLHEILLPQGFHSEIRLALRDGDGLWGALVLFREDSRRHFNDRDTEAVCDIGESLTRAVRSYPVRPIPRQGAPHGAGVVSIAPNDRIVALSEGADAWLADLVPGGDDETHLGDVTRVLFDAAHAVRRGDPARGSTCVRTVRGHWLRVEATAHSLDGSDVAVILQPATSRQLVSAFAAYHRLTPRELDVLDQLMRGQSGKQVARQLGLSLQTVNGHLRSVYRKCGVRGRDELLGRLA
jgi:DNA-binding CsgD family transcriptional regulator